MIRISLKNKLFIGFGFLFIMIILIWIISSYFINDLSNRSATMLKENYQSVESTKFLIQSIDEIKNQQIRFFFGDKVVFNDSIIKNSQKVFEEHLTAVQNNITEEGEQSIIKQLIESYQQYKLTFENNKNLNNIDSTLFFQVLIPEYTITRNLILMLWDMNMEAISNKNMLLKSSAKRAFVILSLIGIICFFLSIFFIFRYPQNIARPIGELIKGITQVADRNYSKRLEIQSNDELGELAKAFNTMTAKLDEYEHSNLSELLFEKRRIDTIINNMKDAIIGLNDKNEIIFSNNYACKILNVNETELVGKYASDIALNNEVFQKIIHNVINQEITEQKDFKPLRIEKDLKVQYFTREVLDVKIKRTGEDEVVKAGIVVVLKNVTQYLEQDEAKTNFMATISHELKTPISSLRLNLKLLDDRRVGSLNTEQQEIVQALKSETKKMLTITTELLDLAQVETGNIQLNFQVVNSTDIFDYIRETSDNHAKSKNIKIEYKVEPDLPPVFVDSEKTAWVLINLINNAIQYSENESKIILTALKEKDNIIYKVQDFGKGIELQYLELIFKKFFRIPNSHAKGTGLGLAISKEFITKQSGKIWAESSPGNGSCFYISLPVFKL
ncbi:MAG: cell wall metabolism sensor histidine kinase WalK [Bacteroidales bacterium]|nr:cell wall metabolism sensor histidine kinase WalK [Bacteroidales bacterium]MCF8457323.1 cell wall metabolism sensor histidine kinase WalK [Bacteroidales bacterium]